MKHRLFTTAAALSLLLCLACVVMWVRSGFVYDEAGAIPSAEEGEDGWMLDSSKGSLSLKISRYGLSAQAGDFEFDALDRGEFPVEWEWKLPRYSSATFPPPPDGAGSASEHQFLLPYWLLTTTTACLPAFWFWEWRRAKKAALRRGFEVQPATEKK